ncbi:hypothetical protein [Hoyosella subflava]|uniref:Integral membrane protein n=1 Tax=Hoyosella subflava (strain DSM 45089 / JCM 17490 / NBRC 109087 / DQS3-9A1) TaxID=443218 RepID=F6ERJ0_HOYSD|nr:hypothetical protein [Hoyosella subflava]AEF38510.1 hypothetical protein AS9A_0050 [Hoyosella subflava DQS3-9A1]
MTNGRSIATALVCAAITLAAHGAAGGHLDASSLIALAPIAVIVGCHATSAFISGKWWKLAGILGAGQAVGHLALHLTGHPHLAVVPEAAATTAPPEPAAMLAAHAIATLLCALLLMWADHLVHMVSTTVGALLFLVVGPVKHDDADAPRIPGSQTPRRMPVHLGSCVSWRGPPVVV